MRSEAPSARACGRTMSLLTRRPAPRVAALAAGSVDGDFAYSQIVARRIAISQAHSCLCATVVGAGVVEILWILLPAGVVDPSAAGQPPDSALFAAIETYVTIGLICELALRMALQRGAFCAQRSNLLDLCVALVSVASSALYAAGLEGAVEMLVAEVLVTARVAFRLLRLLAVSKGLKRPSAGHELEIDLSDAGPGIRWTPSPSPRTPPSPRWPSPRLDETSGDFSV